MLTKGPVPELEEDYSLSARRWFRGTVIAAALTVVFIVCAGAVVLAQRDAEVSQKVSQAFAPFFVGAMAAVTFCGAVWRGKLGSEQIRQQKRQNDAKDDENLAKLLMDGTKLLGEEKDSHVLAGVAALEAVVVSPKAVFSAQAMNILADLIEAVYKDASKTKVVTAAVQAINNGAALDRRSDRVLRLDYDGVIPNNAPIVNGVKVLHLKNATVGYFELQKIRDAKRLIFDNCELEDYTVDGNHNRIKKCGLFQASIKTMNTRFLANNRFENCDFSGAKFMGPIPAKPEGKPHPFAHLGRNENYFRAEDPISGGSHVVWAEYLQCIEPIDPNVAFADDEAEQTESF